MLTLSYRINSISMIKWNSNATRQWRNSMKCCIFNWTFRPVAIQTNHISIVFHMRAHLMCWVAFYSVPFRLNDRISISFGNLDTFHPNESRTDVNNSLFFHCHEILFFRFLWHSNRIKTKINGHFHFCKGNFRFFFLSHEEQFDSVWLHCLFFRCAKTLCYAAMLMNELILTNCEFARTILYYFCIKYCTRYDTNVQTNNTLAHISLSGSQMSTIYRHFLEGSVDYSTFSVPKSANAFETHVKCHPLRKMMTNEFCVKDKSTMSFTR